MRTWSAPALIALALATVLALTGGAVAQDIPYVPTPGTNDLGISENDVRDEPNNFEDGNGFVDKDPFFSPKDGALVLEGTVENRFGNPFALVTYDEDVSNIRNFLMHGDNTDNYEYHIYPGQVVYNAYWGYWSDTGGGGDMRQSSLTGDSPVDEPNGAIDDAAKCLDREWDEFDWRVVESAVPENNDCNHIETADSMYTFIQPGTHNRQFNTLGTPVATALSNHSDHTTEPDFPMSNVVSQQGFVNWRANSGWSRYEYDASLLMETEIITSVNPKAVSGDFGDIRTHYDPFKAGSLPHAHDVDIYTTLHPVLKDAYRNAVWDPGDARNSATDTFDEEGVKAFAKHEGYEAIVSVPIIAGNTISGAMEPLEPSQGTADDLVYGPYKHEPNTDDDVYGIASDGTTQDWATHDPATSYGGLDGDYYEPGSNQNYDGYQSKELYWLDAKAGIDDLPLWIPACCYDIGPGANVRPELPSTDAPIESTAEEGDDNTVAPGIFKVWARSGTWYDANGDTWIGDADSGPSGVFEGFKGYETFTGLPGGQGDDAYDDGTDDDPNDYGSDEFRPVCKADQLTSKVVPTKEVTGPPADDDGDGVAEKDWGHAGVYVVADNGANTNSVYTSPVIDAAGEEGNTATAPVRENPNLGPPLNGTAPADEDGRLSRHRLEGPIELGTWANAFCDSTGSKGRGSWTATKVMVFPGGSLDFPFKTVNTWELAKANFAASKDGTNKGDILTGQTVTDVDHFDPIVDQ